MASRASKILCLIAALVLIIAPATSIAAPLPAPVYGNGCSGGVSWFSRHVLHKVPKWEYCCVPHDRAYGRGGTADQRARADYKLFACVAATDIGPAIWMWTFVRVFGQPLFPFRWRKGFEKDYSAIWWYSRSSAE